jgi:hypothetical protein
MDGEREVVVDELSLRAPARVESVEEAISNVVVYELMNEVQHADLEAFLRDVRPVANKYSWRRLMARRTSAFAALLRRIEVALGDRYLGRARELAGTAWNVVAAGEDGTVRRVARVSAPRPRTVDELCEPILVEIFDAMLPRAAVDFPVRARRSTN